VDYPLQAHFAWHKYALNPYGINKWEKNNRQKRHCTVDFADCFVYKKCEEKGGK